MIHSTVNHCLSIKVVPSFFSYTRAITLATFPKVNNELLIIAHQATTLDTCYVATQGKNVVIFHAFVTSDDLKKYFQVHYPSIKRFGSRSGPTDVTPDLGQNCLQRISAEEARKEPMPQLTELFAFKHSVLEPQDYFVAKS